ARDLRQSLDGALAARRAAIDVGFTGADRLGVGTAALVAAALTLRLRQQAVDVVCQSHAFRSLSAMATRAARQWPDGPATSLSSCRGGCHRPAPADRGRLPCCRLPAPCLQ